MRVDVERVVRIRKIVVFSSVGSAFDPKNVRTNSEAIVNP